MSVDLAELALSVDADGFVKADQKMGAFNKTASNTERQAEKLMQSADRMSKSMASTEAAIGLMTKALAALGVSMSINAITQYANEWTDLNSRLLNVTKSQELANEAMESISDTARRTYSSLQQTAQAYLSNANTLTELGFATKKQLDLSEAMNNALVISGTKGQAAESVMSALSKSFALGKLSGDNFNTVIQQGGRMVEALAAGLNVSTLELRSMANDGLLTTEKVVMALTSQLEKLRKEADAMPATIGDASVIMKNSLLEAVGRLNEVTKAGEDVADTIISIADSIKKMDFTEMDFTKVTDAMEALSLVIGGKLLVSMTKSTAAAIKRLEVAQLERAAYAEQAAMNEAAIAQLAQKAAAERAADISRLESLKSVAAQINAERLLENERLKAQISAQGRILTIQRMAALGTEYALVTNQITAAELRLAAAENIVTESTVRMTVAQRSATIAAGAMNSALALVGGPLGLAMIAGAAIYYLATRANAAQKAVEELNPAVDGVAERFDKMGKAQKVLAEQGLIENIKTQQTEILILQNRLDALGKQAGTTGDKIRGMLGISSDNQKVIELAANLEKAQSSLSELQSAFNTIHPPSDKIISFSVDLSNLNNMLSITTATIGDGVRKAWSMFDDTPKSGIKIVSEEYKKMSRELEKQIATFGAVGNAAGLAYEIEHKMITGLKDGEGEALIALQKRLDVMQQVKKVNDLIAQQKNDIENFGAKTKYEEAIFQIKSKQLVIAGGINSAQGQEYLNNAKILDQKDRELELAKSIEAAYFAGYDNKKGDLESTRLQYELDNGLLTINESLTKEYYKQIIANKKLEETKTNDKLIKDQLKEMEKAADDFGGAWTRTGSIVADAFGTMADSLNDYLKRTDELAKRERKLAEDRQRTSDPKNLAILANEQIKLEQYKVQATISGYGKMAGAAASMFKEESKGRKALNKLEQTFAAIEIALAFKKAAANALVAVTNQGQGDPYTAFARIAAMAAIMAGLGLAVGGGGGGSGPSAKDIQASQGTGSVVGSADAKSESIAKAFDAYKDIAVDQLAELRGIRNAMQGLSSGIAQLAVSLVTSTRFGGGDITGLGETNNHSAATLNGITKLTALTGSPMALMVTAVNKLFGGALDQITDKVFGAVFGTTKKKLKDTGILFDSQSIGDILADGIMDATYYNTIETTKKKLFGLSKSVKTSDQAIAIEDSVMDEFSRIFIFLNSAVSDSLKVLGVDTAKSVNDFIVNIGKVSFKDLSGEQIQKELEAIFGTQADLLAKFVLPQITQYQKMGEGAFETLTRVAREQAIFNDALDHMGLSLGEISNMMRIDVAQSLIAAMGGIEEFSKKTSDYVDKFFTDAEKFQMLSGSLGDVFSTIGEDMPDSIQGFKQLVDGLDLTNKADQNLFATLMDIAPAFADYIKALEKSKEEIIKSEQEIRDVRLQAIQAAVNAAKAERDAAQQQYQAAQTALQSSFNAEINAINAIRDERISALDIELNAAKERQSAAASAVSSAQQALEQAISAQQKMQEDAVQSQIDSYRKVADEAKQYADSLRSLSGNLRSAISDMSVQTTELTLARRLAAQGNIDTALMAARQGDFTAAMNLNDSLTALKDTNGLFTTQSERDYDIAVTQNKLAEIAALSEGQATIEERAYDVAERSAATLEAQLNALGSINGSVLSVYDATQQLTEAQNQLSNFDATVSKLEEQIALEKSTAAEQVATLQAQLDALIGNKEAVLSVDDAIKQFLDAKENLAIMQDQLDVANASLSVFKLMSDVEAAVYDELIAYEKQSSEQQEKLAALSSLQVVYSAQQSSNSQLLAEEISSLRAENKALQQQIANSLKTMAENSTSQLNRDKLRS